MRTRILLATLVVCACNTVADRPQPATSDTTPDEPPQDTGTAVAAPSCENLEVTFLRTQATRAALRQTYGPPDSSSASTEPNRHIEDATDSIFVLHYPGLFAEIRKPASGDDMPVQVRVTGNRYVRHPQIGVGASADAVIRTLGQPNARDPQSMVYDCGIGAEQPVTFRLSDGVVTRVDIDYYVD